MDSCRIIISWTEHLIVVPSDKIATAQEGIKCILDFV